MEPLELWRSEIDAFLNTILNRNGGVEHLELWRSEIDAFLNTILSRNGQLSI